MKPASRSGGVVAAEDVRTTHGDGASTDWHIFRVAPNALRFAELDEEETHVKLEDLAHLRYLKALVRGTPDPIIVVFALLSPDRPAARIFPECSHVTDAGETLCSANSFMTYTLRTLFHRGWIRYVNGRCEPAAPEGARLWRQRASAVLTYLNGTNRIYVRGKDGSKIDFGAAAMQVEQDVVPVAPCGFLSSAVRRCRPELVFNSAFFLLEQDDVFHHHTALGEAHSFWMENGVIQRPPLFRRGALWQDDDEKWHAGLLEPTDLRIRLPDGTRLAHQHALGEAGDRPFALNEEGPGDVTLYTRYYGVAGSGRVLGFTPPDADRLELTVIGRRVVGWKLGGGLALPHHGYVISLAMRSMGRSRFAALLDRLRELRQVDYTFVARSLQRMRQGIQAGPLLLQDGHGILVDHYMRDVEQFWPSRVLDDGSRQIGVVPTNYHADVDRTRAGRVGVGIDADGGLIVVMAAGVNEGMGIPGIDSQGATLTELAEVLKGQGAMQGVNFDGGGSTQAYFQGGRAVVPGDRRGIPGRVYERLVPAVGIVL